MKIYIALWSYGFDDINEAIQKIIATSQIGSKHQLLVSGYFVANLDQPYASNKIATEVLKQHYNEDDVLAVWLPCLLPSRVAVLGNAVRGNQPIKHDIWFDSTDEIHEQYNLVKKLYSSFSDMSKTFSPAFFHGTKQKFPRVTMPKLFAHWLRYRKMIIKSMKSVEL